MRHPITLLAVFLLAGQAFAQKERFDIATYTPPQGWQRVDTNGVRQFFKFRDPNNGMAGFCQIFLYPSRESANDPMENFNAEWSSRVIPATGNTGDPRPQAGKPDKGWTPVTGHVSTQQGGITYNCILISATGYGRVMSIVINMAGQDFVADAEKFLNKFDLDVRGARGGQATASGGPASSGPASLDDYTYTAPPGWTAKRYPDGILIMPNPNPERCNLTLHLIRTAGSNIVADAEQVFAEVFRGFVRKSLGTMDAVIRGTSVQGWDYYMIKRAIGMPGGNYEAMYGFVCVIRAGNKLASISGISKDPLVSSCFGLNLTNVWPNFFYSLHFRNWENPMPQNEMMKRIAGVWMMATATAGDRMVFAPNGRFANAAASQQYALTSSSVVTITDAYFGNGAYALKGNTILLTEDDKKGNPKKGLWRLEDESTDNGNTWKSKLYITRTSDVDGAEYEVSYNRLQGG